MIFMQRASAASKLELLAANSTGFARLSQTIRASVIRTLENIALNWSAVIVQTPFQLTHWAERHPKASLRLLPNNINPSWVHSHSLHVEPPTSQHCHAQIVLIANQYIFGKGLDIALRAVALLVARCKTRMIIVGSGPDEDAVRAKIIALGLESAVTHLGRVEDAHRLLSARPILLSCARIDDCPNVILEGLFHRSPIVASKIPAHIFILGANHPGLVPNEPGEIAQVLERVLNDQSLRRQIVAHQEARRHLFEFDWGARLASLILREDGDGALSPFERRFLRGDLRELVRRDDCSC
jgi:glycosyltransferase involved in cell wall biosynthesis